MANFRSGGSRDRDDSRGSRGGFGGGRSGGSRGGFGGGRRPVEMHDVVCDKCGKDCQVPFKPSGDKPVLCSDCFGKSEGSSRSFGSRGGSSSSGMSAEQFNKIEEKLDKIIKALKIKDESSESE